MSYDLELDNTSDAMSSHLVLHNMVATHQPRSDSKHYMRSMERYLDESDDHELNIQDSHGRTALHVAVQYGNVEAIAGLLMCGADVNVADKQGKTPFTYCLETFDQRKYQSNHMFYIFLGHVHKLIELNLYVNEENRQCYSKARTRHVFNDKQLRISYAVELDKMEDVRVSNNTTLRKVLYEGAEQLSTSTLKRQMLEEIVTASDFYREFPKLCCLIKLQYRRGITRRKQMQPLKYALRILLGLSMPDPCTEPIISYLTDNDLLNLLKAVDYDC
ncbi:uncharacterized protein LOC131675444 [Phymastichus coffea]|uniref:uncharacterized protein LOC131675444 n=1 Tax=Phymastichus coffea TaxID=108790 RepID=UPI00273C51D5|nr:uncharacterized protein LOC131675444 [Phymastichus coffea]